MFVGVKRKGLHKLLKIPCVKYNSELTNLIFYTNFE